MCSWKRAICVPGEGLNVFLEMGNMCSWNRAICTAYKKDKDRRNGKGRCFCLVSIIYSIPCRASCFALDNLKNKDELHQDDLK